MFRKSLSVLILVLCIGLIVSGCSKKTVMKGEPSVMTGEPSGAEREKARLEAERKEREARERAITEKEAARIKEEEAKKTQAQKEFEKSLVTKKTPGIEGQIFESRLLKDIYFDFDKYDIRPQDTAILKENAALLAKSPTVKVQIEGHCDERGTIEYNLALGERRANSAKKYLVSLGISEGRISTISYGKERPLDPGHNEQAWTKNRRTHIIVLSK